MFHVGKNGLITVPRSPCTSVTLPISDQSPTRGRDEKCRSPSDNSRDSRIFRGANVIESRKTSPPVVLLENGFVGCWCIFETPTAPVNYNLDGTCEATAVDALVHAYTRSIHPFPLSLPSSSHPLHPPSPLRPPVRDYPLASPAFRLAPSSRLSLPHPLFTLVFLFPSDLPLYRSTFCWTLPRGPSFSLSSLRLSRSCVLLSCVTPHPPQTLRFSACCPILFASFFSIYRSKIEFEGY